MSKPISKPEHPLAIEVKKTFPLRRIKEISVALPEGGYGNTIKLDREQAMYLYESLGTILEVTDTVAPSDKLPAVLELLKPLFAEVPKYSRSTRMKLELGRRIIAKVQS